MFDRHFLLSRARFARIRSLSPGKVRSVPRVNGRHVIPGIINVIRNRPG